MRIIKETKSIKLPTVAEERLFIQAWYCMVHRNTMDSHRVRNMNSFNILRELKELTLKQDLSGISNDIKMVSEEALSILYEDKIVTAHFNNHYVRIKPLLESICKSTKHKEQEFKQSISLISYYLKDFLAELQGRYKTVVIKALEEAIFISKNKADIFQLTCTLLSALIDEGHSIEELYSIINEVFINNKSGKPHSFSDNFQFMKQLIDHTNYQYELIFRLEGCTKYEFIPSELAEISFQTEVPLGTFDASVQPFLKPGQNVLFSKVKTDAQDDRMAGIFAKRRLDDVLDLIRYEFEHDIIVVSDEFVSSRSGRDRSRIFRLPSQIPNPNKNISAEEFKLFVKMLTDIFEGNSLDRESREKIKSAFRFYRMGRNSELFENKYLNWWTALEYLLRKNHGKIIDEIEGKLKSLLVLNYTSKLLESFRNSLSFCKIKPPTEVCIEFGISDYHELNLFVFYNVMKDKFDVIKNALDDYPLLNLRIEQFIAQTKDAKAISDMLDLHEKHIVWHLHRIWRVRCDIVHSAEYSLNLTLLSANLEFYLKYLLSVLLTSLSSNQGIESLSEFFDRVDYSHQCLKEDLRKGNIDMHNKFLAVGVV